MAAGGPAGSWPVHLRHSSQHTLASVRCVQPPFYSLQQGLSRNIARHAVRAVCLVPQYSRPPFTFPHMLGKSKGHPTTRKAARLCRGTETVSAVYRTFSRARRPSSWWRCASRQTQRSTCTLWSRSKTQRVRAACSRPWPQRSRRTWPCSLAARWPRSRPVPTRACGTHHTPLAAERSAAGVPLRHGLEVAPCEKDSQLK